MIEQYSYTAADTLIKYIGPQHEHYRDHHRGHEPGETNDDGEEFEMNLDGSTPPKCTFAQDYMVKHLKLLAGARIGPRNVRERTLRQVVRAIAHFDIDYAVRHENYDWALEAGCFIDDEPCWEVDDEPTWTTYPAAVRTLKKQAGKLSMGLCLDCFKVGGRFDGTCRVYHA